MVRVIGIGLGILVQIALERAIVDNDFPRLAVKLEEDGAGSILARFTRGEIADDEGFARFDFNGDLFKKKLYEIVDPFGGRKAR